MSVASSSALREQATTADPSEIAGSTRDPKGKRNDFRKALSQLNSVGPASGGGSVQRGSGGGLAGYASVSAQGSRQSVGGHGYPTRRPPPFRPIQTHGSSSSRHGPPVDMGVNTEPLPPIAVGSLYLLMWQLAQLITTLLCYTLFYLDQKEKKRLPRTGANALITFIVLGFIIYVGIVVPLLLSTLNDRLMHKTVRSKRYFSIFVMWLCCDLPSFIIEFHAFVEVGLIDTWQGISFFMTVIWAILPPWIIYLMKMTGKLQKLFGHNAEKYQPQYHNGYRFGHGPAGPGIEAGLLLSTDTQPQFADMREHAAVRQGVLAMYSRAMQAYPNVMTVDQLCDALQRELPHLAPNSPEQYVVLQYLHQVRFSLGGGSVASSDPLVSLVSDALNPARSKALGHEHH